jgi:predicted phosphodiesterase
MSNKNTLKTERARDYVANFPNTPKAALAKLLYKENKSLYNDVEAARAAIRYVTGSLGTKNRKHVSEDEVNKFENGKIHNPFNLPDQKHNEASVHEIAVKPGMRIGLLSDIHIPYQHNEALTLALQHLKQRNIDILYLNGDILDAYEISSFERDPSKKNFAEEIKLCRAFLETLVKEFPGVQIYYKEGNHEARLTMFLRRKAPELLGFEILNYKSLLGLGIPTVKNEPALPIIHIQSKVIARAGKILIVHGHEFAKGFTAPVNPARGFFMKGKSNVIGGHHHQDSAHSENTLSGKQLVAYSTGHLADPHPEYHPYNNWSHGFADITFGEDGNFVVARYKIINGQVINS